MNAPLQERLENFKTLKDEDIDKERGFNEILSSPVFRNFVISEDGKTSGIIVNIKNKEPIENISNKTKEGERNKDHSKGALLRSIGDFGHSIVRRAIQRFCNDIPA